jgi:GR25 family glycosyltransferase involved in LPS biosynthesis
MEDDVILTETFHYLIKFWLIFRKNKRINN